MRGDRLRLLRDNRSLTQKDLADRLHISESQIFRYEKDEIEPRADVVVKLAAYFNVSTDYLLGVSDEPGIYIRSDLNPKEAAVIAAWRRGEKYEAIKEIVEDD